MPDPHGGLDRAGAIEEQDARPIGGRRAGNLRSRRGGTAPALEPSVERGGQSVGVDIARDDDRGVARPMPWRRETR